MADLDNSVYLATINYAREPGQTRCRCGSCDWNGTAAELAEIDDCSLTPGDASPAGRCPSCGELAYVTPSEDDDAVSLARWQAICSQDNWDGQRRVRVLLAFIRERGLLEKLANYAQAEADLP